MFTAKRNGTNETARVDPGRDSTRLRAPQGFITAGDGVGVEFGATEFPLVVLG